MMAYDLSSLLFLKRGRRQEVAAIMRAEFRVNLTQKSAANFASIFR